MKGNREYYWGWISGYNLKQGSQGRLRPKMALEQNPKGSETFFLSLELTILVATLFLVLLLPGMLCAGPTTPPPFCLSSKVTFSEMPSLIKFKRVTPPTFLLYFSITFFFCFKIF